MGTRPVGTGAAAVLDMQQAKCASCELAEHIHSAGFLSKPLHQA